MKINYATPRPEDKADLIITSDTISLAQAVVIAIVKMAKLDAPGTIPNMEVWLTEVDATDIGHPDAINIVDVDGKYDDDWPPSIVKTAWEKFGRRLIFNILRYGKVSYSEAVVHRTLPRIETQMTRIIRELDWGIQTDIYFWVLGMSDENSSLRNPETMAMMAEYMGNIITDKVIRIKDRTI